MEVYRKIRVSSYDAFNWRTLKSIAESGNLDTCLNEGDQISITLKNYDEVLLDFTHDQNGKAYFICHDCYGNHCMNNTATNKGGWRSSKMRRYLNEEILPLLPDDLLDVIVPTKIRQIRDGEELVSEDKLFLLSYTQVFGGEFDDEPDDTQFEIFKKVTQRVKGDTEGDAYCCDTEGDTYCWWLRSACGAGSFHGVRGDGGSYGGNAIAAGSVAFGFCIA